MTQKHYNLEIESDPRNLITVEEFVNYFCKDLNIDEEKMSGLMLSITEATTNAIVHANKSNKEKLVELDVKVVDNKLIVSIKDQGEGFDPSKVPDPTSPENLMKDSGRGLYLMRFYMDDLQYKHTPNGTETILTLNL